jgi:hypothetical protein
MSKVKTYSERQIQDALYIHCAIKRHEIIVPNSCVFGWESDMVSVTRSGYINEFEIKVTRSDFRKDAKKLRARILIDPEAVYSGSYVFRRPNYFYYAVPAGMIEPDDVPEYAGLIYVRKEVHSNTLYYGITSQVKAAVRLHSGKIDEWQRCQLERALTERYWRQRLNGYVAPKVDGEADGQ